MRAVLRHVRGQAVAYVALFVALGGTGYAAVTLPRNSVGTAQLRRGAVSTNQLHNHSLTPVKLASGSIAGYVRAYASVSSNTGQGQIISSRPGAKLIGWRTSGPAPGGLIQFSQPMPASCFALVSLEGAPQAIYATAQLSGTPHSGAAVEVNIATPQSTGNVFVPVAHVAVICPTP